MDVILEILSNLFYYPVGRLLFGQDFVDLAKPPRWQRIVVSIATTLVAILFLLFLWFLFTIL